MHRQMHSGEMDVGKMNRFLGWAQAALVALGVAKLSDFAEINRAAFPKGAE